MTSLNIARAIAFTTLTSLAALPALADQSDNRLSQLCGNGKSLPCVYDPQNKPVGLTTGDGGDTLQRPLNGTWYRVVYELSEGFALAANSDVFFTGPNCPAAGPAYVFANSPIGGKQVPQFLAQYDPDLKVLWGATSATIQPNVQFASRLFGGTCTNGSGTVGPVLPAKIVDPAPPVGPFTIR